jgi:cellulose synthase operon protein C
MARRGLHGWLAVLALAALPSATPRAADAPAVVLSGEAKATATRLAAAQKLLDEKKWPEAVAELQAIVDTGGDALVPLSAERSVAARRLCHARLAALPPEALRLYRDRVEPQARKWLEEATATRDAALLRKVVDEAFCSRSGEKALDLLGDLAFERGHFAEAEGWWRGLSPLDVGKDWEAGELTYPGAQEAARAQAKQLLARLFRGDARFQHDLGAFRARHGKAAGALAGKKGPYADLLAGLAAERKKAPPPAPGWTTFGGDPQRGLVVPGGPDALERLSRLCRAGPTWRFDLETRRRVLAPPPAAGTAVSKPLFARGLAFHPVLAAGQVLLADARRVTAYDQATGESSDWYDAAEEFGGLNPNLKLPAPPDLRYTLTVAGGRVYARLGTQEIQPDAKPGKSESLIVCLSLRPLPGGKRLLWYARPAVVGNAVFEGAPVVCDGVVAAAATHFENDHTVTEVIGYPAATESISPAPLWRTTVCEARELRPGEPRYRHHLLTRAGHRLVYCSHSGAVVALDGLTGRRLWGVRYPRRTDPDEDGPPLRDLTPCLFAEGRLYAAPADSDRLLCLDPDTGKALWEREHTQVVHLLGVGQGRLIYTTPDGLRAVGAADGARAWALPDANGQLPPLGRGLLLGDVVLWPTPPGAGRPYGVYAIRQKDGRQPDGSDPSLLRGIPSGNLVYADGCLAVADRQTLSVFVPPAFDLDERQRQARDNPDSPGALLALARAEAAAGQTDGALASAAKAERLASELPPAAGRLLVTEARRLRHRLLLKAARAAAGEKRWADAEAALKQAAGSEFPPEAQLLALVRTGTLREAAGDFRGAVAAWQSVLSADRLRGLQVEEDGTPAPAGAGAAGRIAALRAKHGDAVYAPFEKEARALREGAAEKGRPALAERLAEAYPNAAVTRTALLDLGRRHEKAHRLLAAAAAYRRALPLGLPKAEEIAALMGLARAYEGMGCSAEARATWLRLDGRHGPEPLPDSAPQRTAHDFVTEHLRGLPPTTVSLPALGPPLYRSWQVRLGAGEFALPLSDSGPGPAADVVWTVRPRGKGAELVCRSASAGSERWACPLPFVPTWLAAHADVVVAAGAGGAAGIGLEAGRLLWHFPAPAHNRHPTATGDRLRVALDPQPPDPLTEFRLAGGRLLLLQGGRRLFALGADSGQVLWYRIAPGAAFALPSPRGQFFPRFYAGPECVLIQTGSGRLWRLDAATGRLLQDEATDGPCPQAPLRLDERNLCLVTGPRQVVLLDPVTGSQRWTYSLTGGTTLTGEAPRVTGNARALLVVIPANVGYFLQRINLLTGKAPWPRPQLLRLDHADTSGWALDDTAVYYPCGGFLCARSLDTGELLWEQPLPGPGRNWRAFRLRDQLLVYPGPAAAPGFLFRWLFGSLQWTMSVPPGAGGRHDFPVLCCDPRTGQVVQRLNFRQAPAAALVRTRTTEEATLLPTLLGTREPAVPPSPTVSFCQGRMIVALPGVVWAVAGDDNHSATPKD